MLEDIGLDNFFNKVGNIQQCFFRKFKRKVLKNFMIKGKNILTLKL